MLSAVHIVQTLPHNKMDTILYIKKLFSFCSHSYCSSLNETGTKQEQSINIVQLEYNNSIKSMTYEQGVYFSFLFWSTLIINGGQ